jgi:hypothetical protein
MVEIGIYEVLFWDMRQVMDLDMWLFILKAIRLSEGYKHVLTVRYTPVYLM